MKNILLDVDRTKFFLLKPIKTSFFFLKRKYQDSFSKMSMKMLLALLLVAIATVHCTTDPNDITVVTTNMSDDMMIDAKAQMAIAIDLYPQSTTNIANNVKKYFNTYYNPTWICIVERRSSPGTFTGLTSHQYYIQLFLAQSAGLGYDLALYKN